MLMPPPQNPAPPSPNVPPAPPQEPKPDAGGFYTQVSPADPMASQSTQQAGKFDFMLNEQPKPKKSFGLPSGMGKPAKFAILGVGVLIIIFAMASIFGGGDSVSKQVVDLIAQDQEIIRVTKLQQRQLKDVNVLNLAATTEAIMTSQQADYSAYLRKIKVKYGTKDLALRRSKTIDAQLQTAEADNNLDNAYVLYLSAAMATYRKSMTATYKASNSVTLKNYLKSAFSSTDVFLKSPQFLAVSGN